MAYIVAAHLVMAVVVLASARRLRRWTFLVAALAPAAAVAYVATQGAAVRTGGVVTQTLSWVPSVGFSLDLRLDALSWVMALVVAGVGVAVLVYCVQYVADDDPHVGALAAGLTAFAGVMLGLVTADNLVALYLFWEATTVLSYLLIGTTGHGASSVVAAKQALVVTTVGGLAMLVGIVILGQTFGTYTLSGIVAAASVRAPDALTATAVVLLLAGALTKSAQVPFHFWLPGAMAAPTPVSAYLHAASMVKAGVYLVARLAPGFSSYPVWSYVVTIAGSATMLLGGYRALRQFDLKLVLAYGTVSQLGFLVLLVGYGTPDALYAGLAVLVAHALFKAALFLTVGAIDHGYGTRDLRRLSGLARAHPALTTGGVVAAAAMAGLPPTLGFVAKEAAVEATLHAHSPLQTVTLVAVVLGSVLTVAYSARFVWGAFGTRTTPFPAPLGHPIGALLVAVPVTLAAANLLLGPVSGGLEPYLSRAVAALGETHAHLGLWHGLTTALAVSVAVWVVGGALFVARRAVAHAQAAVPRVPDAASTYQRLVHLLDRAALEVTGLLSTGSTNATLAVILGVFVLLPTGALLVGGATGRPDLVLADNPAQLGVAVVVALAALLAARSRRRYRAVFLVGVTGYGVAFLFLIHGAPDLALTQVLVETVSIVVFVLVLRRFSGRFEDEGPRLARWSRVAVGAVVGVAVAGFALVAAAARHELPAATTLPERAVDYGGGANIVNVILVDVRAWDTMGELSVVLAAAAGIASLVFVSRETAERVRTGNVAVRGARVSALVSGWLAAHVAERERSTILAVVTRMVFHVVMLWSVYLLFAGHNLPGGGFAAGLVAGLALVMRYLAGSGYELRMAAPVVPGLLLGLGLSVASLSAALPLLFGSAALRTWIVDVHVPLVGDVHIVTSLLFDVGVYLVVVGLVLTILRTLGTALDRQISDEVAR